MNCREALNKIYEFLDRDGTVPLNEIEKHLDCCRHCWDRFEFEKRLIEMFKSSCCKSPCSEKLRDRIKALLDKY